MGEYRVRIGDRSLDLHLGPDGQIAIDGTPYACEIVQLKGHEFLIRSETTQHRVTIVQRDGAFLVATDGLTMQVEVESPRERLIREHAREQTAEHARAEIHAPMPAMVVRVEVSEGESVSAGQGLIVLEAMKMENELRAPRDGVVKAVHAQEGNAVEKGSLLMLLE